MNKTTIDTMNWEYKPDGLIKINIFVTGESNISIKSWADFFYYYKKIIKIDFMNITDENDIYDYPVPEDRTRLLVIITTDDLLTKTKIMNFDL